MTDASTPASAPETDPHGSQAPGRGMVLTPVPPGGSLLVLGLVLATLAPLAGFLGGSMIGIKDDAASSISPLYLSLFVGIVLGGFGLILAGFGGLRLYRHLRSQSPKA